MGVAAAGQFHIMNWIIAAFKGRLKPTDRTELVTRAAVIVSILAFMALLVTTLAA